MGRKLLKTVQTITTFRNHLAAPVGTRRGPRLVRGPQFENRCYSSCFVFTKHPVQLKTVTTHTHPFNGPFSGTTRVGRYQKGKTNLDFTEARDNEWQWHQLASAGKSAPCSRQITTPVPHHSVFYRPDALPAALPTAAKHSHVFKICSFQKRAPKQKGGCLDTPPGYAADFSNCFE